MVSPAAIFGSHSAFCASLPPYFSKPPPITTVGT